MQTLAKVCSYSYLYFHLNFLFSYPFVVLSIYGVRSFIIALSSLPVFLFLSDVNLTHLSCFMGKKIHDLLINAMRL